MKELDGSLFKSSIDLEDNHRIIFSAKFGAGKTYFLKKFFQKYSDDYEPIFLYPVNYQVSANEDIFELVEVSLKVYESYQKRICLIDLWL
jgi:predicted NACHT family NTPase